MSNDFFGTLEGKDSADSGIRIRLDADHGDVTIGGAGRGGDLSMRDVFFASSRSARRRPFRCIFR